MKTKLKEEIITTLYWFAQMDINLFGAITESTKEAFAAQSVEIPKHFLTPND